MVRERREGTKDDGLERQARENFVVGVLLENIRDKYEKVPLVLVVDDATESFEVLLGSLRQPLEVMGVARELLTVAKAGNKIQGCLAVRVVGGDKNDVEVERDQSVELIAKGEGFGSRALQGILGRLV